MVPRRCSHLPLSPGSPGTIAHLADFERLYAAPLARLGPAVAPEGGRLAMMFAGYRQLREAHAALQAPLMAFWAASQARAAMVQDATCRSVRLA